MSTKDFIKKSVLNAFTQYDAPKLAVALLAALALGILIYQNYSISASRGSLSTPISQLVMFAFPITILLL